VNRPNVTNRKGLGLFALVAGAIVLWWFLRPSARFTDTLSGNSPSSGESKIENQKSKIPGPLEIHDLARDLNSPTHDIRADLQIVSTVLETYRSNFLRDGNPVGNNREITATLTGDNRLRLALLAPTHPAINAAGELCDRWGTPFFFHAESSTQMEIRSAGPDRQHFTADDAVLSP
jgi:hypothetical protein